MAKGADGRMRITQVTLRPRIAFGGEPDAAALDALHHKAHEACFIANSVTSEMVSRTALKVVALARLRR